MADIDTALAKVLLHEGGYVNNPNDAGGPTKYGITQKDMPNVDIQNLDVHTAITYYKEHYIKPLYAQVLNQEVLDKLVDCGVLFGVGTAVKILQKTVGAIPDGNFGEETLGDVNAFNPSTLLSSYKEAMQNHAVSVVSANPKDAVFLKGWESRINA